MIREYKITGMHCASCAANVERAARSIKGVEAANVNLLAEKLRVRSESNVDDEIIKALLAPALRPCFRKHIKGSKRYSAP